MTRKNSDAAPPAENMIDKLAAASRTALDRQLAGGMIAEPDDELLDPGDEPTDDLPDSVQAEDPIVAAVKIATAAAEAENAEKAAQQQNLWAFYVRTLRRTDPLSPEVVRDLGFAIADLHLFAEKVNLHRDIIAEAMKLELLIPQAAQAREDAAEARTKFSELEKRHREEWLAARHAVDATTGKARACHEAGTELLQLARQAPMIFERIRPGKTPRLLGSGST